MPSNERAADEPPKNKFFEFCKILGMGIGAVALVPVLLHMISSSLLKEAETSMESKFVLLGFCVAATVAARRVLTVIPQKLLDAVDRIDKKTDDQQEQLHAGLNAVANRTAPTLQPPPPDIQEAIKSSSASKYNWKALRLIRAFFNPKFTKSRTVTGLAFDSGLSIDETLRYLEQLRKDGDVHKFPGDPKKGSWWTMTADGRKNFSSLKSQLDQLDFSDTDVE
jgi:hypothetical protein